MEEQFYENEMDIEMDRQLDAIYSSQREFEDQYCLSADL